MTRAADPVPHTPPGPSAARATLAGFCAALVGVGIARFGYTPLIPLLISQHWFEAGQAAYLGAFNLLGYLAGALLADPLARRLPLPLVLRASMIASAIGMLACAWHAPFGWFVLWRVVTGVSGGILTVLAPAAVLSRIPFHRQGAVGGILFGGVGLGIVASGTLVPLLMRFGLSETWLGLGFICVIGVLAAWNGWPEVRRAPVAAVEGTRPGRNPRLWIVIVCYGLNGLGFVPFMLFLVDMIARGRGFGIDAGALCWVVFGLAALAGPMVCGWFADKMGIDIALPLAFALQAGAAALVVAPVPFWLTLVGAAVIGVFVPGIVPLVLGRVRDALPGDPRRQARGWTACTAMLALSTAAGGYGMSALFARGVGYDVLFLLGALAIVLALALDLAGLAFARRR
ncbi:MFS transporter [Azorhizobium oxalatiphilum]|uniref:MFS transporter n=1 Tax=Azorhizobium oxalatiphilum TaxID=980631 RepID=A0A917FCD4_9HYPH|nr:YbfB/YjiJ family MFS transporter [Azorhizobium oxalatiphilum]GGF65747.1 MFS transporter [Azorhizobium oxalatiphilum]